MLLVLVSLALSAPLPPPDDVLPSLSGRWMLDGLLQGDFNGDGHPEVMYWSHFALVPPADNDAHLLTSDGQRLLPTPVQTFRDHTPTQTLPDIDGDGDDEVLMERDAPFETLYVPGSPTGLRTASATPLRTRGRPTGSGVVLGDLDHDGWEDLGMHVGTPIYNPRLGGVEYDYRLAIYPGTPTGFSALASMEIPELSLARTVRTDLDGDGWTDTVMSAGKERYRGGQIFVAWGDPTGVSGPLEVWDDPETCGRALTLLGDLDGDGDDEVMFECGFPAHQRLLLLEGQRGSLSTRTWMPSAVFEPGFRHTTADFDGDGRLDLVIGEPSASRVSIYTGLDPSRPPQPTWVYEAPSTGVGGALAAADLDHDGRDELMTIRHVRNANGSMGEIVVWYGR